MHARRPSHGSPLFALAPVLAFVACGGGSAPTAPVATTASDAGAPTNGPGALAYPAWNAVDVPATFHGKTVHDPYRALEDAKDPDVKAWVTAEDALARAELGKLPERDAIAARLKELMYFDFKSAPEHRGKRYFYGARHADKEKEIVHVKDADGTERVLLDPNTWSTDGSSSLGEWRPSWDGSHVAYTVHKNNADEATLYVIDVATGKISDVDVIDGAKYAGPSWTPDGKGFYYGYLPTDPSLPTAERPGYAEIRFHRLGDKPSADVVVHDKLGDPTTFQSAWLSKDGHFLVYEIDHGWTANDLYVADVRKTAGYPGKDGKVAFTPAVVGKTAHYGPTIYKDRLYVTTDEGAPRGRAFAADAARPGRDGWKEILPTRDGSKLEGVGVLGGKLVAQYLTAATTGIEIHDLSGAKIRDVALPSLGSASLSGEEDEDTAYLGFTSYAHPDDVQAVSIATGDEKPYSRREVPFDPSPYTIDQVAYPSKDGTKITMFVVKKKDFVADGKARALLYGYGGFEASQTPVFRSDLVPWVERGGVFAVANLRGGGEYGEAWHEGGMLTKKQNVFDDFEAAAKYLADTKLSSPSRIAIMGASNGGLLVAATMTQTPDRFGAVICGVPLTDMIRYGEVGAGKTWTSEYGSVDDPAQFDALLAYSPYHHEEAGKTYPALLMASADSDDRVDPMHARKFVAALQGTAAGGPFLLRVEKNAGHGGAGLVKAKVEETADKLAFALAHTR